jgi:hypothetical protein
LPDECMIEKRIDGCKIILVNKLWNKLEYSFIMNIIFVHYSVTRYTNSDITEEFMSRAHKLYSDWALKSIQHFIIPLPF